MIWPRTDGLRSGPETSHLGCVWHTEAIGFAAGSRQFASKLAPTASGPNQKRTLSIWPTTGLLPGGRASLLAMGCAAALKPATSVVSDEPSRPVLLPVPGNSRASLLPRPPARIKGGRCLFGPQRGFCPEGVGTGRRFACPRKGLCILRNAPSETPSSRTSPTQKRSVARSAPTLIDRGRATR